MKNSELFVITLTLSLANGRVSTVGVSMGQHSLFISMPLFYTTALAGSAMVLSLSQLIARPLSQIESLSMSLISILGFQAIFTRAYRNMIGFNQNIFVSIFSASCIVFFCYMMHLFTMRYLPEVLGKKRK